jgi:hypothetical protein
MWREDFPDCPFPWELRAYLWSDEPWELRDIKGNLFFKEQVSTFRPVYLLRAQAMEWGLWPAVESPQTAATEESPFANEQPSPRAAKLSAEVRRDGVRVIIDVPQVPQEHQQRPPATQPDETEERAIILGSRPADRDMASNEPASPDKQLNDSTGDIQTSAHTQNTRGQPEVPRPDAQQRSVGRPAIPWRPEFDPRVAKGEADGETLEITAEAVIKLMSKTPGIDKNKLPAVPSLMNLISKSRGAGMSVTEWRARDRNEE